MQIRFDVAYHTHFKCNIRSIRGDYPALHRWLRRLYWTVPAFKDTSNFQHIKAVYSNMIIVSPFIYIYREMTLKSRLGRSIRSRSSLWARCQISYHCSVE